MSGEQKDALNGTKMLCILAGENLSLAEKIAEDVNPDNLDYKTLVEEMCSVRICAKQQHLLQNLALKVPAKKLDLPWLIEARDSKQSKHDSKNPAFDELILKAILEIEKNPKKFLMDNKLISDSASNVDGD